MAVKIAIIDYQLSNLFSVKHACESIGLSAIITSDKAKLLDSKAAILPGVGAFGDAMKNLKKLDLIETIRKFIETGRPFMGICLGMQLLLSESEEFGHHKGLNIIKGKVKKFTRIKDKSLKIPQIGWNSIYRPKNHSDIWKGTPFVNIDNNEYMYFVHSYYVVPENKTYVLSQTRYGNIEYCSSILYKNIFATQFHPEKSGKEGIKIYQNWASLIRQENSYEKV